MKDETSTARAEFDAVVILALGLACGWSFRMVVDYGVGDGSGFLPFALAGWLAATIRTRGASAREHLALLTLMVFAVWALDRGLADLEARLSTLGWTASAAAPLLRLLGVSAASGEAGLLLEHPEGGLALGTSFEKTAARPAAAWLLALAVGLWARRGWRGLLLFLPALGATLLAHVVRFALLGASVLSVKDVLASSFPSKIAYFWSPWGLATYLALAAALSRAACTAWARREAPPARIRFRAATCLAAVVLVACWALPVPERPARSGGLGRVLIDDSFSDGWAPAGRRLSLDWYGDYSTYNLNALAQHLGRRFSVKVNAGEPYTPGLLGDVDVLILKTPVHPIPPEDRRAILDFARNGGSLFVIGDHTNLLWMGTHLNRLLEETGMRFRYDALARASDGGFNQHVPRPWRREHPLVRGLERFEWLTSCSIDPGPSGRVVMVAEDAVRQPHDYASSSFFGNPGHHPAFEVGPHVVVAEREFGAGRVLLMADSTCLSSFSYHARGHDDFMLRAVKWLLANPRRSRAAEGALAVVAGIALLGLLALGARGLGRALPWAAGGVITGLLVAGAAGRSLVYVPDDPTPPPSSIPTVAFVQEGTWSDYPPALGSVGDAPAAALFDTFMGIPPRLGWETMEVGGLEAAVDRRPSAIVVANPIKPASPAALRRLYGYLHGGGRLLLLDRSAHHEFSAAPHWLAWLGFDLHFDHGPGKAGWHSEGGLRETRDAAGGWTLWTGAVGRGRVLVLHESDLLSREGLGHSFAYPDRERRARFQAAAHLLTHGLGLRAVDGAEYEILGEPPPRRR